MTKNHLTNELFNQVDQFAQFTKSIVLDAFMQNKPNLCPFCPVNDDYEEKQTQTNPIQTQNKAIFSTKNRPQTQNKPNSNPTCPCAGRDPVFVLKLATFLPHQCGSRYSKPPAELRNSARQKKINTMSLNENELANQKYQEKEKT